MKKSAGILLIRSTEKELEFFLVHPGGPFFQKKNEGWWTIPKGEILLDEDPLNAAVREFEEETGHKLHGAFHPVPPIKQKGGKEVLCWVIEKDIDPSTIRSNNFEIEWPPKSGIRRQFPEIDKAGWFNYSEAKVLINIKQVPFLDEALQIHNRSAEF
ncbi:NUDIX hydrolase [Olivibacter domesticus]|uniref:Predicted NTP pyrophosphohydrolase, NUDIX family n=1 Tax=Olivibacter domesticus TaxID=407022 RepID=A0A1H7IMG4_OLID1|nr:NUDIX domain-containing protein [Olivibacter domesticus]SEK63608.1 Predicted NTP pyrophosphohydrolase, NUDIX family [Olivibacter domesticus]